MAAAARSWMDKVLYPLVVASILGAVGVYALATENRARITSAENGAHVLREDLVRHLERIERKIDRIEDRLNQLK